MKKLLIAVIVFCSSFAHAQWILPPILQRKPVASGSSTTSNSPVLVTNLVIVPTGSPIVVR